MNASLRQRVAHVGLVLLALMIVANAAFVGFNQGKKGALLKFRILRTGNIGLVLFHSPNNKTRRAFGFYQLVDLHLPDGADLQVPASLAQHLWHLRYYSAVDARQVDAPLLLTDEQAERLERRAFRSLPYHVGRAWFVGNPSDPARDSYVLADAASDDRMFLLPESEYRQVVGRPHDSTAPDGGLAAGDASVPAAAPEHHEGAGAQ